MGKTRKKFKKSPGDLKLDTQEHLIEHVEIQSKVTYGNLFSTSPGEILEVANVLKQGLDLRT